MIGVGAGMLLSGLVGAAGQLIQNRWNAKREDTAVQRRAVDMEAAGFNRTLAAGSPASSAPMQSPITAGAEKAMLALQVMQQKKNVELVEAQVKNVQADTAAKQQNVDFGAYTLQGRILAAQADSVLKKHQAEVAVQARDWIAADLSVQRKTAVEIEQLAKQYDMYIKRSDAYKADYAERLQAAAYDDIVAGRVANPEYSTAVSKALAMKLLQKEVDWYSTNQLLRAGGSILNMVTPFVK